MPLHGKIVVIKRSGVDGTEFPLTASCLFGRKQECDIRIQLPSVSKEHCRIDLNENKEVILTNLSSANPTCVNGETLHQSERLKHGDVITIVDRSFRFEYPPAPTPKKRSSTGAKSETLKVLRDHQVSDSVIAESGERRNFEVSTGPHFKDGANIDIQRSLEKTLEEESKEDGGHLQSKTNSPFGDLYQMIKKSLDVKTPRKSCVSQVQTPSSKFCTPRPGSVMKIGRKSANFTPKREETKLLEEPKFESCEGPQSGKKLGKTISVSPAAVGPKMKRDDCAAESEATSKQRRSSVTVQKFTASEVLEVISAPALKSPTRRMSKETKLAQTAEEQEQQGTASPKATPKRTSPRNSGAAETEVPKKHKRGDVKSDLLAQKIKKKRVSFGGHLSPELFDKHLPPDSPLRRGATPRRSLSLCKPKHSVFRRASVIGFLKEQSSAKSKTLSPKNSLGVQGASPKTPRGKKLPKSGSPSPKATSPGKKAPTSASPAQTSPKFKSSSPKGTPLLQESLRSRSTSPKAVTPAKTSSRSSSPALAKSRSTSPKAATPAKTSPKSRSSSPALAKSRSTSPKAVTPAKTSPKSRSSSPALAKSRSTSPKAVTPAKTSSRSSSPALAKSRSTSPKAATPATTSSKSRSSSPALAKSRSTSPKAVTPAKTSPKSRSSSPALAKSRSTSPKAATPSKTSSRSSSPATESKIKRKCGSPSQKAYNTTPTDKRRSSLRESSLVSLTGVTPVKASLDSGVSTPNVQGRFSVSRINTPSPTSESDAVTQQEPLSTVTPKIQLKRRSMKRTSRRTPGVSKSAAHVLQRKSGVSRASMKVINSWADIVKFGQAKTQVVAPTKTKVTQKPKKKVPKLQTPARTLKSHASTGHADSPATIFVGRAHKRAVAHPTGAAPRVVTNTALSKKDMKMDENLSGISEMFKTPANNRKRRSSITESSARKSRSVIEQTVLNTPEEPGEMIVSPLNVASTVKSRRYNSEAVQRLLNEEQESSFTGGTPALEVHSKSGGEQDADLKMSATTPVQKPELAELLPEVKRIMKTPKEKPEQIDCLTGVKRIMKTPRQKAEPLEDIRGRLLITPKQKPAERECLTGVKRIFRTPKQKAELVEDLRGKLLKTPKTREVDEVSFDGIKELLETPVQVQKSDHQFEMTNVKTPNIKSSPVVCLTDVERVLKTPKHKNSPVEDTRTPKEKGKPVEDNFGINRLMRSPRLRGVAPVEDFEGLQELLQEPPTEVETNKVIMKTLPQEAAEAPQQQPKEETSPYKVKEMDPSTEEKPVRGRKGKTVKLKITEDKVKVPEPSEDPVISAPARGRRGKKAEVAAPPIVCRTTRGRNAEATDIDPTEKESTPQPSKSAPRPRRGRYATKPPEDSSETVQEVTEEKVTPDPEGEQRPSTGFQHKEEDGDAQVEKAELKPKRGMKNKRLQNKACAQTQDVSQAEVPKDANDAHSEHPEVLPGAMEAVVQAPDVEEVTEKSAAPAQKKPVRGRRAKLAEPKETQDKQEATCPDELVSALVRGRRGKQRDVAAPPAVQQVTRTGNAKSQKSASNQPVKAQVVPEVSPDATSVQTSLHTTQETKDPGPSTSQVTLKLVRGRKTKLAPVALEDAEAVSKDDVTGQPPQPVPAAAGKPTRGRKRKCEEQNELVENTVVTEDVEQQFQPPVRAKRGRSAQQKEEEQTDSGVRTTSQKTSNCPEPVKKSRRTGKPVDHKEEDQPSQVVVPEEADILPAEPVVMPEQAVVAAKPRRGGRKAKPDTKAEEAVEVPAVSTDTPKRGRGGKRVAQKVAFVENLEPEEQKNISASPQMIKATRAKGRKDEIPEDIPAKRARRGAATHETNGESAVQAPAPAPVKPAKRGKQASAKPTRAKEAPVTDDPANPSEDLSEAASEESKLKKSVQFDSDLQVFEIPKATPVKAGRGRKPKLADAKSDSVSKVVKPEEDLSDVKAQPVKRGRRGVKVADVTAGCAREEKDAEPQPQTRRGRSARK